MADCVALLFASLQYGQEYTVIELLNVYYFLHHPYPICIQQRNGA